MRREAGESSHPFYSTYALLAVRAGLAPAVTSLRWERAQKGVDFGRLVLRADPFERFSGFLPRQTSVGRIPERPRGLAELAQQLRLKKPVFETFRLEDSDAQGCNAGI